MRTISTAVIAAVFVMTGCTLEPTYNRPPAPVPASFPVDDIHARQPAIETTAAANIGWRDFFGDARLQKIVALAIANNRDLRVSLLNVEAARAQYQVARLGFLPTFDAIASQSKSRTPLDVVNHGQPSISNQYTVGAFASWEIDLFGRTLSLKHEALDQFFSIANNRKAAEISLVASVANQYLLLVANDEQLAVTESTLTDAKESLRLTKLLFENGERSELDLRQAETVADQAQANRQAQLRARAEAENALILLVGAPLPADLPAGLSLEQQKIADVPAGLPSDLLEQRPDIVAAEQMLKAANDSIGAARAAFFPEISLTGDFGTQSKQLGGLFKPGSAAWAFGPQISLPIFDAGQNKANLDLAQIQKRIEIANYEKAIQTAFREVADGLAGRDTFDREMKAVERQTRSQQRTLALSELRYRQGVDSYLQVLVARNGLYSAQQQLVNVRLQRLTNLVDLYRYLGGGWIEHTGDQPRPAEVSAT